MSKEAANAFIVKAQSDNEIKQKLAGLSSSATADDIIDVAATFGYKFSEQELTEAAKNEIESQTNQTVELSEADLEAVVGGNTPISGIVSRTVTQSIMK